MKAPYDNDFDNLLAWINSDASPPADSPYSEIIEAANGRRFSRCDNGTIWFEDDEKEVSLDEAKSLIWGHGGARPHPPGREGGRPANQYPKRNLVIQSTDAEHKQIIDSLTTRQRTEVLMNKVLDIMQIGLSETGRGRLIDIPGMGKCAMQGCPNQAHNNIIVMSENVNLSAVRSEATDWGGAGVKGYLCDRHYATMSQYTVIAIEGDLKDVLGEVLAQGRNDGLGTYPEGEVDWAVIRLPLTEARKLAEIRAVYPANQGKFGWGYTRHPINPKDL